MTDTVMLPSDEERKRLFWYLKRNTSYTAWERIYGFYKRWVELFEKNAVYCIDHAPPDRFPALTDTDLIKVLKGLAEFEKALTRLKKGDKRIFQYNYHGDIVMALNPASWFTELLWKWEDGEIKLRTEEIPWWDELRQADDDMSRAWGECYPSFMQTRDPNEPAPLVYNDWYRNEIARLRIPEPLPDVPDPADDVFARTGQRLPYTGIWEPVQVEWTGGFLGMFQHARKGENHRFPLTGCMNYLHAFDRAPQASVVTTTGSGRDIDVVWRLLWKDDRYRDGAIPEEESRYTFLQPEAPQQPRPAADVLIQASGETCRRSGIWVQVSHRDISQIILSGETVPAWYGTPVSWIWMREQ